MSLELIKSSLPTQFRGMLSTIGILDILDILVVAFILYKIYAMLKDTRAITLLKGVVVLLIVTAITTWFNLYVIAWLLQHTVTLLFVALPIVFQPELRRALEHLGQGKFLTSATNLNYEARSIVDELVKVTKSLSSTKTGALIVIERDMRLNDISSTGVPVAGFVTSELLSNIFIKNTPLHDGAVVIRGNRVIAAACLLPLTESRDLSTELGTRHRSAIGLSEQCDALIIIVSEETGTISVAENGHIMRHLDADTLKAVLRPLYVTEQRGLLDRFEFVDKIRNKIDK